MIFRSCPRASCPGVAEDFLGPLIVAHDDMIFVDGDDGVGGAVQDAGVNFLFLAQLLKLAEQCLQKRGAGAGDEVGRVLAEENSGSPAGQ